MCEYQFSLTRILPYRDRVLDSVFIRENKGQWKPVFSHILCSEKKMCYCKSVSMKRCFLIYLLLYLLKLIFSRKTNVFILKVMKIADSKEIKNGSRNFGYFYGTKLYGRVEVLFTTDVLRVAMGWVTSKLMS